MAASEGPPSGRTYNEIYEKLVRDEDDLVGMIAYALYKQSKREWILGQEDRNARPTTEDEERLFVSSYTAFDLGRLRDQAEEMLSAYAAYIIEQETPKIREDAQQTHLITRVDATLQQVAAQSAWWRQVGAGVLGAFGYSIALLALALVIHWVGSDLFGLLRSA